MSWIDEAMPLPAARAVEADEALDVAASALIAVAASVAAMQAFAGFVLERPGEAAIYGLALLATGAAGFVPLDSPRRRVALAASGSASVVVWLAMLPLARDGAATVVVLALAAASALLTRRLIDSGEGDDEDSAPQSGARDDVGWIEADEVSRLQA